MSEKNQIVVVLIVALVLGAFVDRIGLDLLGRGIGERAVEFAGARQLL